MDVKDVSLGKIRPHLRVKINYADFERGLEELLAKLAGYGGKLPVVHITIEGEDIDKVKVQRRLSEALQGKCLYRHVDFKEKVRGSSLTIASHERLDMKTLFKQYFLQQKSDQREAELLAERALEILEAFKEGGVEGAKKVIGDFFEAFKNDD